METFSKQVQSEGLARVRILSILSTSYIIFWSPLFAVTLFSWSWSWEYAKNSTAHVVSIYLLTTRGRMEGGGGCFIRLSMDLYHLLTISRLLTRAGRIKFATFAYSYSHYIVHTSIDKVVILLQIKIKY